MEKLAKLSCMAAGLFLVLYGLVSLKHQIGGGSTDAPLSVKKVPTEDQREPRVMGNPTILQTQPLNAQEGQSPRFGSSDFGSQEAAETEEPLLPGVTVPEQPRETTESWPQPVQPIPVPPGFPPPEHFPVEANDLSTQLDPQVPPQSSHTGGWPAEQQTVLPASAVQADRVKPGGEDPHTWRLREDDSLWEVSKARYGTGEYYHALFAYNRKLIHRPDRLPAGLLLQTPSEAVLRTEFPALCPRNAKTAGR